MSVLLLTMGPQLGITADLPVVGVGGAGVIRFRAIGASGPVKWTLVDSTLPAEWDSALNPDGNAVTLTTADAETAGTFSVTVRAVDSARIPVVRSFDVRVMALPLTISGSFPNWERGAPATGSLTISGGVPPYSGLSIISGEIPAGVSLSIVGSQIVPSGSPTATGAWAATIGVMDSDGSPAQIYVSGEVVGDPYAEYVSALLHFNGADGSTVFADATGKSWTALGGAQIDTAQSKFGGASGLFNGSSARVTCPQSADLEFGSDDFTLECWVRPTVAGTNKVIVGNWRGVSASYCAYILYITSGNRLQLSYGVGSTNDGTPSTTPIVMDVWTHVVAQRKGTTVEYFINGVKDSTTYPLVGALNSYPDEPTSIGCISPNTGASLFFNGHIDELRITKGIARYDGNFTPPAEPYPNP